MIAFSEQNSIENSVNKRQHLRSLSSNSQVDIRMTYQDKIRQSSLNMGKKSSALKNNTVFSTTKVRPHQVNRLFESVFNKIPPRKTLISIRSRTMLNSKKQEYKKSQNEQLPTSLVDTLYRQNIKNYNAFTATLQVLEEQRLGAIEKQRISKLCHIGAAKQFIKNKKHSQAPTYNRVNVQIRPYMRQKMHEEMRVKQQKYQNIVFIPCTELALSFNPLNYPKGLQDSISQQYFQSIVREVNLIIEKQYVTYKASNIHVFTESFLAKVVLTLIALLTFIFFINPVPELLGVVFGMVVIWLLLSVRQCKVKLQELVRSKNVTNTILERINKFFQRVNTEQTEWKVGEDFYWLEVHFIRKNNKVFRHK